MAVLLAATPTPTKVFTVKVDWSISIEVSASAPSGSHVFDDEKEVLASITTSNYYYSLVSIGMTTVSSTN